MRNEISHQSYSVACFNSDKKALIEVAKYVDEAKSEKISGFNTTTSPNPTGNSYRLGYEPLITSGLSQWTSFSSRSSAASDQTCSLPPTNSATTSRPSRRNIG
jgi:hypothetical protein